MNTKTFLYSLFLFTLSSCASLISSEFAQRKYYDFPRTKHYVTGKQTGYAYIKTPETKLIRDIVKEANKTELQSLSLSASAKDKESVVVKPESNEICLKQIKASKTSELMHELKQEAGTSKNFEFLRPAASSNPDCLRGNSAFSDLSASDFFVFRSTQTPVVSYKKPNPTAACLPKVAPWHHGRRVNSEYLGLDRWLAGVVQPAKRLHKILSSDSDIMLIILVVLSLVIPPLAVYIKNNHKTDNWFFITLILWLLSFAGFGFNPFYGLWLIAAVIAILVVFDILN